MVKIRLGFRDFTLKGKENVMKKRVTCLTFLLLAMMALGTANAQVINIMTTQPGSFTHSAGSAIAKLIIEKVGANSTVQPQAVRNFGVVDSGLAVFSLASAGDLVLATLGAEEYEELGPKPHLRVVATLMPLRTALHVRKDSDIKTIPDLKGKRVGYGFKSQKAVGRSVTAMLANGGLTYDDVKKVPAPNIISQAQDFSAGKSDVLFFALGSAKVMEVAAKVGGLRVLPLDDSPEAIARLQEINPTAYIDVVQPAPGLEGVFEPTKTTHMDLIFYTHDRVSDDIIYKVVKAIYENKEDLVASFAAFKPFRPERIATPLKNIDYHPGAIKFYKEVGLWQAQK